ncbi:ATP-binding protein [Pseudonocardia bannensis]|uniref:ATP-binding protein n=1 Tax=Pseudonocardia bannensis TaxID=630973 RepID=UPI0034D9590E
MIDRTRHDLPGHGGGRDPRRRRRPGHPGRPAGPAVRAVRPAGRDGLENGDPTRPGTEPQARRGTGLGLVLARGLTEAIGGRLQVCSVAGEGTSVEVVLPGPGQ